MSKAVTVRNLMHLPVLVCLNSGRTVHLGPRTPAGAKSTGSDQLQTLQSDVSKKMLRLAERGVIKLEGVKRVAAKAAPAKQPPSKRGGKSKSEKTSEPKTSKNGS